MPHEPHLPRPAGLLDSFASTLRSVATYPWRSAAPGAAAVTELARVGVSVAGLLAGRTPADVATDLAADEAGDRRFDDPAFREMPAYFAAHRTHSVARHCLAELVAAGGGGGEVTRLEAAFTAAWCWTPCADLSAEKAEEATVEENGIGDRC